MNNVIKTDNINSALADLISQYQPTKDSPVEYDLSIEESNENKCVISINGDEYVIEVTP